MVWVRISLLSDKGVNQGVLFEKSRCTSIDVITALGEEVEYEILENHVPDMSQFVVARVTITKKDGSTKSFVLSSGAVVVDYLSKTCDETVNPDPSDKTGVWIYCQTGFESEKP